MKNILMRICLICAAFLALPAMLSIILHPSGINKVYTVRGTYDKSLGKLNTMAELESFVKASVRHRGISFPEAADSILKLRFYHGTCRYEFTENWGASVLGMLIWDDFRMKTVSEDILKEEVAVCNQVNIVFQDLLRNNRWRFRTVGFKHHLVTEVFADGNWQVFDADYEPGLTGRPSAAELLSDSAGFVKIYSETEGRKFNPHFGELLMTRKPVYGKEGSRLAGNLSILQRALDIFSSFGWLAFLIPAVLLKYF